MAYEILLALIFYNEESRILLAIAEMLFNIAHILVTTFNNPKKTIRHYKKGPHFLQYSP